MKDPRCLFGFHRYAKHQIEGGHGTYLECRTCAKADDGYEPAVNGVFPFMWF